MSVLSWAVLASSSAASSLTAASFMEQSRDITSSRAEKQKPTALKRLSLSALIASHPLGHPELGAAGAGIAPALFLPGDDRLAADAFQGLNKAAGAHRGLPGAGAASLPGGNSAFDDPVLQGMKADDAEAAAGIDPCGSSFLITCPNVPD